MEAFVIYLFLAAFVLASTVLRWWGGFQLGCEEGTAPSAGNRKDLYGHPITHPTALGKGIVGCLASGVVSVYPSSV
jgi:hypothetical protein